MKTKKKVYINWATLVVVGLYKDLMYELRGTDIVENEKPKVFHSSSNKSAGCWMRTDDMNILYSGFIGEQVMISAMIGMHDQTNPYLDEVLSIAVTDNAIYIIEGTRFFITHTAGNILSDDDLYAIVKGIVEKKVIQGVLQTPKE